MQRNRVILSAAILATLTCLLAMALSTSAPQPSIGGTSAAADASSVVPGAHSLPAAENSSDPEREAATAAPTSSHGFYAARPGSGMEGAFRLSSESSVLHLERKSETGGTVVVEGAAQLRVLDGTPEELVYRLTLSELRCRAVDSRGGAVESTDDPFLLELVRPVLVRLRRDGTPRGLRFAPGTSHKARTWLRGYVQAFRMTLPDETRDDWELEEHDNAGTSLASYGVIERSEGELSLSRTKSELHLHEPLAVLREFTSEALARASLGSRWCEEVRVEESAAFGLEGLELVVKTTTRGSLELAPVASVQPEAVDWDAPWDALTATTAENAAAAAASSEERWRRQQASQTLAGLMDALERALSQDPLDDQLLMELQTALAQRLRTLPGALGELEAFLAGGVVSELAARYALLAVGSTQSPAAQSYLARRAADESAPLAQRLDSLRSMAQLDDPGEEVLETLRRGVRRSGDSDAYQRTAMLLAGAVATKARAPEASAELLQELLEQEASVQGTEQLRSWLLALGNTGAPRALDALLRYTEHADENARHAVAHAMRRFTEQRATDALVGLARQDSSHRVRGRAVEHLGAREDVSAFEAACAALRDDPSEFVRQSAVTGLARRISRPEVRAELEAAAKGDASEAVRGLARSFLDA